MRDPFFKTVELKTICPHCGVCHDGATSVDHGREPQDDAITLCTSCGEWSFFSSVHKNGLRKPTDDELIEIGLDATAKHVRAQWHATMSPEARAKAKAEAEKPRPKHATRLADEWAEHSAAMEIDGDEDEKVAAHMKALFYMGAMACYQVFDESRKTLDTQPITDMKRELNIFCESYIAETNRSKSKGGGK